MRYTPLVKKYRPKKLSEIVGQDVLVRTLTNALTSESVYNAYLLYGGFGGGKTSAARVIAASLNCEKGVSAEPCGTCDNCTSIIAGKHVDVVELDAASHRGIDEIRAIRKESQYSPVNARYKVFIVDECHALSGAAAEAMLKIMEEPPSEVVFILATTERHKMINTILSRCQEFKVVTLPWNLIAAHLKDICHKEGVTIDDDAIRLIAKSSSGHMRDGIKNLDTVIMYAGGQKITLAVAEASIGTVDDSAFFDLIDCVIQRKFSDGVRCLQNILLKGQNIEMILNSLFDHFRTLLVIRCCDNTSGILSLNEEEKKRFLHQATSLQPDAIDEMMTYLVEINKGVAVNVNPQVLLEQFLLRSIRCHVQYQSTK